MSDDKIGRAQAEVYRSAQAAKQRETYFSKGDELVASTSAQGMIAGKHYKVTDIQSQSVGMFGDVVQYELTPIDGGSPIWVGNAHLLLDKV